MSVQTVSILCSCFSVSADIVQFVYTCISIVGRLVATGTVASPITGLQERQQCFKMLQTVHFVVTLLPNMPIWSFIHWQSLSKHIYLSIFLPSFIPSLIPSSVVPSFLALLVPPSLFPFFHHSFLLSFSHWFLYVLPYFLHSLVLPSVFPSSLPSSHVPSLLRPFLFDSLVSVHPSFPLSFFLASFCHRFLHVLSVFSSFLSSVFY